MPMTLLTFDALVDAFFDKCKEVMKTKGADYTKQSDNKLANFERTALRLGVSPLRVIQIYQDKHRDCIDSYIENGTLESSESLEMRFVDEVNYDLLKIAQAIAEGYVPAEVWLRGALNTPGPPGPDANGDVPEPPMAGASPPMRIVDAPEQMERTGQVCCNSEGEDCCDGEDEG